MRYANILNLRQTVVLTVPYNLWPFFIGQSPKNTNSTFEFVTARANPSSVEKNMDAGMQILAYSLPMYIEGNTQLSSRLQLQYLSYDLRPN